MQIEMRDLARAAAAENAAAAAALFCAVPPLVPVRHSRLRFGHGHPVADDRKTVLGGAHEYQSRKILVLGASGLIGRFVTDDLRARGFQAIGVARHLSPSQKTSAFDLELAVMSMDAASLARLIREREIDVVVNCLGVLQDGPGSDTSAVHRDFVERLLAAIRDSGRAIRLVHISIPGTADEDRTAFSQTKREAERLIAASGIAYAILRPGFVVAPSAYGGSAMLRALAAFPLQLPADESATPFQPVAVEDIAATIAWLAGARHRRRRGKRRDMGSDAAATDHARQCDRSIPLVVRHRTACRASRCRPSCSISARSSAISPTGSAGCRRCARPRSPNCAAASPAIPQPGWRRPASCRRRIAQTVGRARRHHPGQMVRAAVSGQGAGDREPRGVLDRVRLHLAGDFLSSRRRHFALARLSAVAGRARDDPHQPDGHEHRRPDRLPPHLRRSA